MPSKIGKLREAEVTLVHGATTAEACRRIAVSEQTDYSVAQGIWLSENRPGASDGGAHEGNTSRYSWRINLPNSALRLSVPSLQFRFNWAGLPKSRSVQPH